MNYRARAKQLLNSFAGRYGYEMIPRASVYDWQREQGKRLNHRDSTLPQDATGYLRFDSPRLLELQERYTHFQSDASIPFVWKDGYIQADDLRYFRGDNVYVWQARGRNMSVIAYALTTFFTKSSDPLGLLERLEEDDRFGNVWFRIDGKKISRDLLDSIAEIYFLERHLQVSKLSDCRFLDIGAGYGRLAHRMLGAMPNIQTYYCTDAVPASTFISEYYLRFRKCDDRAEVVPLYEIEDTLANCRVDVAVNVHSFSECSIPAIEWWLVRLRTAAVKHLMIVPNALDNGGKLLRTNDGQDVQKVVEKHGYRLKVKEPKFADPVVQQYGLDPTWHYLFELS